MFDFDVALSHSRFADADPVGNHIPEAVGTVLSAGATIDNYRKAYGSLRWRYFGPRALVEDNSERSLATSLFNLEAGYQLARNLRLNLSVFNLFNASDSDIDYFYASRLPGEPADGIEDFHTHPTIPRTARVNIVVGILGRAVRSLAGHLPVCDTQLTGPHLAFGANHSRFSSCVSVGRPRDRVN